MGTISILARRFTIGFHRACKTSKEVQRVSPSVKTREIYADHIFIMLIFISHFGPFV